ncbi:MAG: hypothetical protein ABEJ23_06140 [Haloarculaceae archaeon]
MGRELPYRYLFGQLVREEWRLHTTLFGGTRFALFPAFVALVAAGATTFFALASVDGEMLVAGVHVLVLLVGLQVGTVGLVGRDALEDLLGDTTLLLYSARTLPVSQERLLLAFLVKDVAYYAALFILPLVVGLAPLTVLGGLAPLRLAVAAVTATWTFALGVATSLALVGLYTRTRLGVTLVALALAALAVLRGGLVLSVLPYQLTVAPSPLAAATSLVLTLGLGAVGVALFDFDRRTPARTAPDRFRALHARLGGFDEQGVLAKSLLDVHRSSGGVWKVAFSQGLVFAVLAVLLVSIPRIVPVEPSPGLAVAAILALGTFTTYNWLCQFEDEQFYLRYPVALPTVFRGKLYAFLLLAVPVGLVYLALGAVVFDPGTALLGAVTFVPLALYVFGVTTYVAGLQPNELLFDTPTFAGFSVAMALVLIPIVVVAIAYPLDPARLSALAVGVALLAGAVGVVLYRRTGARWAAKARTA